MMASNADSSHLQIEPEHEELRKGETPESKYAFCTKNPTHENFIPLKEFTLDHLPKEIRDPEVLNRIQLNAARTVLLKVSRCSESRKQCNDCLFKVSNVSEANQMTGTGYVYGNGQSVVCEKTGSCPCHECRVSETPRQKYWEIRVFTVTHVVFDNFEAKNTVVECFHDSQHDRKDIVTLYGTGIHGLQSQHELTQTDVSGLLVCVTHDEDSISKLKFPTPDELVGVARCFDETEYGVIVSHPHGCSKMVTIGNVIWKQVPVTPGRNVGEFEEIIENTYCRFEKDGKSVIYRLNPSNRFEDDCEYECYENVKFCLPAKAQYMAKASWQQTWYTFPPGTRFSSGNGTNLAIPGTAEFLFPSDSKEVFSQGVRIVHNIPTCCGSSGALVFTGWGGSTLLSFCSPLHRGSSKTSKLNFSSISNGSNAKFSC